MDNGAAAGTCGIVSVVLIIVYIYLSVSTLEPTEYGIDFSRVTYKLGETNQGGREWLGIGHYYIKFPAQVRRLEFKSANSEFKKGDLLRSRTSDGLEVKLELALQYRFGINDVQPVYAKFGLNYENVYVQMVIETITRAATEFSSTQFFGERTTIQNDFEAKIKTIFRDEAFADINNFQLLTVDLPSAFQDAIQNTQVQRQDVTKAEQERGTQRVEGETRVAQALVQQNTIRINGETNARTIELNNVAYVEQFNITQRAQADSYQGVFDQLGDTDETREENLLEYLRMRAMRDHADSNSIINMAGGKQATPAQEL